MKESTNDPFILWIRGDWLPTYENVMNELLQVGIPEVSAPGIPLFVCICQTTYNEYYWLEYVDAFFFNIILGHKSSLLVIRCDILEGGSCILAQNYKFYIESRYFTNMNI